MRLFSKFKFEMQDTEEVEVTRLSDILDLGLCDKELLTQNDIKINENNNEITKINKHAYNGVSMYGKNNYGNIKLMNENANKNDFCNLLSVTIHIQIKHSIYKDYGVMYFGVTESNFNVSKNQYIAFEKEKGKNKKQAKIKIKK